MNTPVIQVEVTIPTQTKYLDLIGCIGERLVKELQDYSGDPEALAYQLNLVLTEATTNAILHNSPNVAKQTVKIVIQIHNNEIIIRVYDHGLGFDLDAVPLPDFGSLQENGMGLFFIRSFMDSISYTQHDDGNVLEMRKDLNKTTTSDSLA